MREERGQLPGNCVVYEEFTLWGSIGGDCSVIKGGKFYVRGSIYGNMVVEDGGRVHIYGNIQGNVTIHKGAKVIHSGVVGGSIYNQGGRLFVELCSSTGGKIKTTDDGQTKFEPKANFAADEPPSRYKIK